MSIHASYAKWLDDYAFIDDKGMVRIHRGAPDMNTYNWETHMPPGMLQLRRMALCMATHKRLASSSRLSQLSSDVLQCIGEMSERQNAFPALWSLAHHDIVQICRQQIFSGRFNCMAFLCKNGDVFRIGSNQIGMSLSEEDSKFENVPGYETTVRVPREFTGGEKVIQICLFRRSICMLTENGHIFFFDSPGFLNSSSNSAQIPPSFYRLDNENLKIVMISACGDSALLVLTECGNLFYHDQRGVTHISEWENDDVGTPAVKERIVYVSSYHHSYAFVTESGQLFTGCHIAKIISNVATSQVIKFYGHLGHGSNDPIPHDRPRRVENFLMPAKDRFYKVVMGFQTLCALTEFGQVWVCGWNKDGRLGIPNNGNPYHVYNLTRFSQKHFAGKKIIDIHTSSFQSLAVDEDHNLWMWGKSFKNHKSTASETPHVIPGVKVSSGTTPDMPQDKIEPLCRLFGNGPSFVKQRALAFAMGSHQDLGLQSTIQMLKPDLIRSIFEKSLEEDDSEQDGLEDDDSEENESEDDYNF